MSKVFALLTASLCFAQLALADGRECFFPDHSRAVNFTECNASATHSSCCRDTEACLSNGLCLQQVGLPNRVTRGACTDSTFSNAACPDKCTDVGAGASTSFYLAYDTPPSGGFCCYPGFDNVTRQCMLDANGAGTKTPFTLPEGTVIIDRSNGARLSINTTSNSTAPESVVTATVTASSVSNGYTLAVGAGVGVPLGVLLLAALAACAMLYSQLRKAKRELQRGEILMESAPSGSGDMHKHGHNSSPSSGSANPFIDRSGTATSYPHGSQYVGQHPVEAYGQFIAEAPTERGVAMADSRELRKP